ncbi:MAG: CesT family type III secretion system chaperone [Xenococcaceae cyanobacterium MO_207.B15]|nr:CesT family type III secretion system chaperone [Xenococcaceae cyanobacterium MO_207.B15]
MQAERITIILSEIFPQSTIERQTDKSWQVANETIRILILLSDDGSWLRILTPIAAQKDAQPFLENLMEANFDGTGEARYGLGQNVLWGLFQHSLESLTEEDFCSAIASVVSLAEKGLSQAFQGVIENRIREIVQAAKTQGQTKEVTYQMIERFYQEGMLGGLDQPAEERNSFLAAWKAQLDRLWGE